MFVIPQVKKASSYARQSAHSGIAATHGSQPSASIAPSAVYQPPATAPAVMSQPTAGNTSSS